MNCDFSDKLNCVKITGSLYLINQYEIKLYWPGMFTHTRNFFRMREAPECNRMTATGHR